MKKVILSVSNDLSSDQRLHRMATALQALGYEVECVGRRRRKSLPLSPRPYAATRLGLFFEKKAWFYAELNLRLFFYLLWAKVDVLTANDLDTLPANWLAAVLRGKRLIYDSHEYFTETPELAHRPLVKKTWLALERFLFPRLQTVITVNDTIAEIYQNLYGKKVETVMNLPLRVAPPPENLPKEPIIIYQGAVNLGRGVELMLESVRLLPADYRLWIVGGGDRLAACQRLAQALGLEEPRVKFWGPQPFEKLPAITQQAAVGLSLEEDLGLNYRYATPNKLFDYLQCGLPVVAANLPLMRQLVEKHQIGFILEDRSPEKLAALLQNLIENAELYSRCQANALAAAQTLCWENEKQKLTLIYGPANDN